MPYCYNCMKEVSVTHGCCSECGKALRQMRDASDAYLLPLGAKLDQGNITIGEKLGSGGFGITYIARDIKWGLIALKEFYPKFMINCSRNDQSLVIDGENLEYFKKFKKQFQRESETLSKLNHKNIVKVYFDFSENNTCYYGMELLKGMSLQNYCKQNGKMSPKDAWNLLKPIFDAVEYIHGKEILHRDLSPNNIYLRTMPNGKLDPCLIDFGAAYDAVQYYSQSVARVRTNGYSPPEQNAGREIIGPYSDVYSMAAILYYMVTEQVPLPSEDRALQAQAMKSPHELNSDVSVEFSDLLMKAMEIDYHKRTQSIHELREDIERMFPPPSPPVPSHRKNGFPAVVVDALLFAFCWFFVTQLDLFEKMFKGNVWIEGAIAFGMALLINIFMGLITKQTLGEWLLRLPKAKEKNWFVHVLLQTCYPYALVKGIIDSIHKEKTPQPPSPPSPSVPPPPPPPSLDAYLIPDESQYPGMCLSKQFGLSKDGQTLGRKNDPASSCDIPVTEMLCVSRKQCYIGFSGVWYIQDCHSSNGTCLNGKMLVPDDRYELTDGDTIFLGSQKIVLIFHEKYTGVN